MIELRWAVPEHTTAQAPRLQYRQCAPIVSFGAPAGWSEWQDVPFVVVPQESPKTAPTVLSALGVTASEVRPSRDAVNALERLEGALLDQDSPYIPGVREFLGELRTALGVPAYDPAQLIREWVRLKRAMDKAPNQAAYEQAEVEWQAVNRKFMDYADGVSVAAGETPPPADADGDRP